MLAALVERKILGMLCLHGLEMLQLYAQTHVVWPPVLLSPLLGNAPNLGAGSTLLKCLRPLIPPGLARLTGPT